MNTLTVPKATILISAALLLSISATAQAVESTSFPKMSPSEAVALSDDMARIADPDFLTSSRESNNQDQVLLPSKDDPSSTIFNPSLGNVSINSPGVNFSTQSSSSISQGPTNYVATRIKDGIRYTSISYNEKESSKHTYTMSLPEGLFLSPLDNGSIAITSAGSRALTVGKIEKPWAIDANGKSLPTHYDVTGNEITQKIDTEGAKFPIVADPKITYGVGVYLNLTGAEMNAIRMGSGLVAGQSCRLSSGIPNKVLKGIVKVLCKLGGESLMDDIVKETLAHPNAYREACYQRQYPDVKNRGFVPVNSKNCK